jgi:membrane associated rhomboid family serine protease
MLPLTDDVPTARLPIVTLALVAVNLVVYLISLRHGGSLLGGPTNAVADHYGAIPHEFTHSGTRWATAISSMFLHASVLHLLGNMLFLYIFGKNVEDSMGRLRFLAFYILGGLVALAIQVAVDPNSLAPTIGASGAIAAVLGGYILLYPRAKVLSLVFIILFFTIIEIPAILMLAIWFAEQAVLGAAGLADPTGSRGGVAYFAHVGGFVFGLLLIKAFATRRQPVPA